jgi:two-component system cell cycle sensor histidine kinase/response regulator CckA
VSREESDDGLDRAAPRFRKPRSSSAPRSSTAKRRDPEERLRRNNDILRAITDAQLAYIASSDAGAVFDRLLAVLLEITDSEYGFIGEVVRRHGRPLLRVYAITDLSWDEESRRRVQIAGKDGLEFDNLATLFGAALVSGKPVIANDPSHDPRRGGLPAGHPELRAFLGIPIHHHGELVGMCGVANRSDGYDDSMVTELEPLLVTCANLIASVRLEAARARAEKALRESERRFRGYFELDLIGIAITSPEKGWIEVNDRICALLGRTREQLLAMTWSELTHPDDLPADLANFDRVLRGEIDSYTMGKRFLRSDGQVLHTMLSVRCIRRDDGRVDYFMGLVQDITELRRVQEERRALERRMFEAQKLESLGVLAGGIAHDFNNLLTGILGNAGLARCAIEEQADPSVHLAQIERAAARAADLCRQMLAYAGKGRFLVAPIDVAELVRGTIDLLRLSIRKNARLHIDLDTRCPRVIGDETQIQQVVMNLVMNASDALPASGGAIDIRVHPLKVRSPQAAPEFGHGELKAGAYVLIEVRDEGCGMSRETLTRMFDPFFTTKFTGRGLGLSAVLGILKSHDGAVRVSSVEGQGTSFRLFFPAATPERAGAAALPDPTVAKERSERGVALVVDDEPLVADTVASMLRHLSFEVLIAADGDAALATFRANPNRIGLVFVDFTMPGIDGLETSRRIRDVDPEARIVLMSGYSESEAARRFAENSIDGYLAKPFKVGDLREMLRTIRR